MTTNKSAITKITRPILSGVVQRGRLFALIDAKVAKPVTWISAPGGSGKSTLVASYLDARKLPCIWYECDDGDSDLATFFYYMGLAAKKGAPLTKNTLPLLRPEYLSGIPTFTRRYFEKLYGCFNTIVFENYQNVTDADSFHDMMVNVLDCIPEGVHIVVISRNDPPIAMARLQANGKINLLNYRDLCFTIDESRELVHG